jgi:hypothetical protein
MGHHGTAHSPHIHAEEMKRIEDKTAPASTVEHSHPVDRTNQHDRNVPRRATSNGVFDYEIAGWPLTFVLVIVMITIGVVGLVLKVFGVM